MENYIFNKIDIKLPLKSGYYYTDKGLLFFNIENKCWYGNETLENLWLDINEWFEKTNDTFSLLEFIELFSFVLRFGNPLAYQNFINNLMNNKINKLKLKIFIISKREKDFKNHLEFISKFHKNM